MKCPCTVTWPCQMHGELKKNLISLPKILDPHSRKHLRMGLVPQRCCSDLWEAFAAPAVEVCWQALLRCTFSSTEHFVQWNLLCQHWNLLVVREAANTLPGIEGMCATSIHSFPGNTAYSNLHFKTREPFLGITLILFMLPA